MRVDLHVELHHVENRRPADSAPCFAGLGRFSFNWQGPLRKMSKVVDPRDTKALFRRNSLRERISLDYNPLLLHTAWFQNVNRKFDPSID